MGGSRRATLDALMRQAVQDAKVLTRFANFVCNQHGDCLTWDGMRTRGGYGQFSIRSRKVYAHRFAYIAAGEPNGPLSPDLDLDHVTCDAGHEGCVTPHHMRPATHRSNVLRGNSISARQARKDRCPKCHGSYTVRPDTNERRCLKCDSIYRAAYQRVSRAGGSPEAARRAGQLALALPKMAPGWHCGPRRGRKAFDFISYIRWPASLCKADALPLS